MNQCLANKRSVLGFLAAAAVLASGSAFAAAADVIDAVDGLAADASTGVTTGVTIGAVVFGAKVVWGAIKSMA